MTPPSKATPTAPHPEKRERTTTWHGQDLRDEYAWLRAENWRDVMRDPGVLDPSIRAHLESENEFAGASLAHTAALQDALFAEMKARLKEDDSSVPAPDGPYEYFFKFTPGGQYPRLCRRPCGGDDESVLLDGDAEAAGAAYWSIGDAAHSPDHRFLAYAVDGNGSELYAVRIRDLATGRDLPDLIAGTRGSIVWSNDGRSLFYVRLDAEHRPRFVHRHVLGEDPADDALVFEEKSTGYYVNLSKTHSSKFVVIDSHDHQSNEVYLIDADAPRTPPRLVAEREHGHEYSVEHWDRKAIVTTNSGGAEDFRICEAPADAPGRGNWTEIVAHQPGRLILDAVAFKRHLVRLERVDSLPRIVVRRFADGEEHTVSFPEEAYSLGMSPGYEFDTGTLRFSYSSMTTPAQTFDYDMETRARTLRKTQEVPSGHDPADYVTRRIEATAPDGETVPVSILHRKTTLIDGSAPLLLYGYGAYGFAIPASFSTNRLSLVDRGFVYAIAHIRGGKDKGYRWYTNGKLKKKTNTFTDFIAAGERLADLGYTRRGRIVAHGGSAGGMLMGAITNLAPDLFLGIVADVPFVDVLNTMLDDTLPLTPPEWLEWGNPIASAEDFAKIRSYSPYDNVARMPYPHILALAGLTDPRVTYWEPAKWVARLRDMTTGGNRVLFKVNMDAGHGGASGRFSALKDVALEYAFALDIAGLAMAAPQTSSASRVTPRVTA